MSYNVAVVGATGNVGRIMLQILESRNFPLKNLYLLASKNSLGTHMPFKGENLPVQDLAEFDFQNTDIALASPGGSISAEFAPKAANAGTIWIDNTSHFRMDVDVPLIIPEINPNKIADYKNKNIIANPNCSTIQMLLALAPLHEKFVIRRVVVSTYQSVSGAGKKGQDELLAQLGGNNAQSKFSRQIAHNVIPQIDRFLENGTTKEEQKMVDETHKILDKNIRVNATCVRVPVMIGHSESLNIETERPIPPAQAAQILSRANGVRVDVQGDKFKTPLEIAGSDEVHISRIRADTTVPNGLSMWCVADNTRVGAALNAVKIAELLIKRR
ncbi:MAG: aspartate-semialdehyde dehydrogenase [Lactobacillales bacterium]|jgi:aspartate-semialdehyde dehydrogenase|nr:aspartate-semialdehyde dehydrogenase [Lactobacillales bacterium]